jgi:hypothetical protein
LVEAEAEPSPSSAISLRKQFAPGGGASLNTGNGGGDWTRLGGVESGLTRALGELRQAMAEGRDAKRGPALKLDDYLEYKAAQSAALQAIEATASKEILSSEGSTTGEEGAS